MLIVTLKKKDDKVSHKSWGLITKLPDKIRFGFLYLKTPFSSHKEKTHFFFQNLCVYMYIFYCILSTYFYNQIM